MRTKIPSSYVDHVAGLERRLCTDEALKRAVGGEFLAVGKLEHYLLRSRGLRDDDLVIDLGCGSGRLACQLAAFASMRYIGCDVVPRLLAYAEELCHRPDWRFVHTDGVTIPSEDGTADFVCSFSVFTHLAQEDVYRYFREAHRVLKPGGLLIMSFLEFLVPSHWSTFIASVDGRRDEDHLNQFIERDAIKTWASHSGFDVRGIHAGDTPYIPLPDEIVYENGTRVSGAGSLGQSVAVLQKRAEGGGAAAEAPGLLREGTVPRSGLSPLTTLPAATSRVDVPLLNVSTRTRLAAGGSLSVGFVIGGSAARRMLIRAVGPALNLFGVHAVMVHPTLAVYRDDVLCATSPAEESGISSVAAIAAAVGAFPLPAGGNDAALLLAANPGNYSAVVRGADAAEEGEVLVEVYFVD